MNEWIKTWRGGEFLILRSDMKTCILKQPSHLFLFIYLLFLWKRQPAEPQRGQLMKCRGIENSIPSIPLLQEQQPVCVCGWAKDGREAASGRKNRAVKLSICCQAYSVNTGCSFSTSKWSSRFVSPNRLALTISSTSSEGLLFIYSAEWGRGRRVEL